MDSIKGAGSSVDALPEALQRNFELLAFLPEQPATWDAEFLANIWEVEPTEAAEIARSLADRGLLEPAEPGRYAIHALLVTLARSLCDDDLGEEAG